MTKTIWKFELDITDSQHVQMPKGAEVLAVQVQRDRPCIWAMVDPAAATEIRHFETFGTGHDIFCDMGIERNYVGTYQVQGGSLVFHVFERIN